MAKEYKITSLRLADLEKELNYLKTTREREVAAMIAEARSYGDLSENSEYDAAKNEQGAGDTKDIAHLCGFFCGQGLGWLLCGHVRYPV
jgi:hypothetical protein